MLKTFLIALLTLGIISVAFLLYKFVPSETLIQQTIQTPSQTTSGLTADESFVLSNILEPRVTEKERTIFQIALSKAALESDQLDVTACSPKPVVWNLSKKKDLVVKNDDQVAHTLTIYASKYQVPAKGSITIPADFAENGHIYTYSCDDISIAGIFWLPKQ
ncbi:MAG: hypothetical protein Q7S63_00715 [bacterium]|nr:hypothetical protein [bacterium]